MSYSDHIALDEFKYPFALAFVIRSVDYCNHTRYVLLRRVLSDWGEAEAVAVLRLKFKDAFPGSDAFDPLPVEPVVPRPPPLG